MTAHVHGPQVRAIVRATARASARSSVFGRLAFVGGAGSLLGIGTAGVILLTSTDVGAATLCAVVAMSVAFGAVLSGPPVPAHSDYAFHAPHPVSIGTYVLARLIGILVFVMTWLAATNWAPLLVIGWTYGFEAAGTAAAGSLLAACAVTMAAVFAKSVVVSASSTRRTLLVFAGSAVGSVFAAVAYSTLSHGVPRILDLAPELLRWSDLLYPPIWFSAITAASHSLSPVTITGLSCAVLACVIPAFAIWSVIPHLLRTVRKGGSTRSQLSAALIRAPRLRNESLATMLMFQGRLRHDGEFVRRLAALAPLLIPIVLPGRADVSDATLVGSSFWNLTWCAVVLILGFRVFLIWSDSDHSASWIYRVSPARIWRLARTANLLVLCSVWAPISIVAAFKAFRASPLTEAFIGVLIGTLFVAVLLEGLALSVNDPMASLPAKGSLKVFVVLSLFSVAVVPFFIIRVGLAVQRPSLVFAGGLVTILAIEAIASRLTFRGGSEPSHLQENGEGT